MKTMNILIDSMLKKSSIVKSKKLTEVDLEEFIRDYQDALFETLHENGYVRISENIQINLVRLKDRRYVLRGNSYKNNRKFKLRTYIDKSLYDKIEKSFDIIGEDY